MGLSLLSRLVLGALAAVSVAPSIAALTVSGSAAAAAADEVTTTVIHEGKSLTLRLHPASVRGPGFEVLLQQADGSYTPQAAPAPRTYLGSVDGDPAAYASAIRTSGGKLEGQVVFDRGATWFFRDGAVTNTRGLTPPSEHRWPSATNAARNVTVTPGQIGTTVRRWDLGVDVDTPWYTAAASGSGSVAATLDAVERMAVEMLGTYTGNSLLRPALGRVVIRGSAQSTPYTSAALDSIKTEWRTNQAEGTWDAVLLLQTYNGGGLAWLGGVGDRGWNYARAGGAGPQTVISRHELGHTWGADDNHTNGPEGPTIMSGNAYARFDGTELSAMLRTRDARLDAFPADAGPYAEPLPPYAALDLLDGTFSGVPITARPTANDADANADALTLTSVAATSHLGGKVTRNGGEITYLPPAVSTANTTDWFSYVVTDATGKTATGIVLTRVSPNTAPAPVGTWKADDVITGVPYELVNRHTGLLAAVPVGSTATVSGKKRRTSSTAMAPLVQRERDGNGTRFTITADGAGYRLRNVAGGGCAEVEGGSTRDGARVLHYPCRNSPNQQWRVLAHPDGGLAIVNARSGRCLLPRGGTFAANAELTQASCGHIAAQHWDLRAVPAPVSEWANAAPQDTSAAYSLTNLATGLRAAGANATDTMPALVLRSGDDAASRFVLAPAPSGGHTLRVQSTSRACLQVHWSSKDAGVDVTSWYCSDDADRRWRILANPAGGTSLQNVNSGLCLTATDPADTGPDLVQRACGISATQRWNLAAGI